MIIKESADKIILIGSMKGPRIMAALLTIFLISSAYLWNVPYLLIGLIMAIPLMFLGNTGKCIITQKDKQIAFVRRKTLKLKSTIQGYPISEIQDVNIVRAPARSENDGFGIGFKINSEWKNAINNFTLSEKKAKKILKIIKDRIKDV